MGGPLAKRIERTHPQELTEAEKNDLVPEIEAAATTSGAAKYGPRSLFWRSKKPSGSSQLLELLVTLRSRQGRTRIGIEERLHGLVALIYGGLVGGVGVGVGVGVGIGVGVGALHSLVFALAFPTVFLAGSLFVARETLSYVSRRRRHELSELLARLSEYATDRDSRDAE